MLTTHNDVHRQFAAYFNSKELEPYLYLLSKRMREGHICIDLNDLNKDEIQVEFPGFQIKKTLLENHPLVSNGKTYKPFVLDHDKLYMQRYYSYESDIIAQINAFIQSENATQEYYKTQLLKHKDFIFKLFNQSTSEQVNWQYIAILSAVLNQFTIITGGPGTGKTTTVAKILSLMYTLNPKFKVVLAAPTGKAANRLSESLRQVHFPDIFIQNAVQKIEPSTIHRLLGTQRDSIYFKHNANHPIPYDMIVIDEASMIDAALFSKLLDAVNPRSKLILLGDKDQLASVEAGSLFGDLCMAQKKLNTFSPSRIEFFQHFMNHDLDLTYFQENSKHILFEHVIVLKHSYRFSSDDGIGKISKAIIDNQTHDILSFFENSDANVRIDQDYSEQVFQTFVDGYHAYIEENEISLAFKKLNKLRVLCALREGSEGVVHINEIIEKYLQDKNWIRKDTEFYEHRPVMMTTNNYNLGLFNGDIGIVRKDNEGKLKVWFENSEGKLISFLPATIIEAETVFAMTIHKSQGSEFENVMVVLPKNNDSTLLSSELLYTAITRAKKSVIIQGSQTVIMDCANRRVQRGSGIIERLDNI